MARQMTRSPHADLAPKRRRRGARGRWALALLAAACGGRELSLGGDPSSLALGASGGSSQTGAGNGGALASAGTSGAVSTAGTGGFSIGLGGSSGSSAAPSGGAVSRDYPPVRWGNGEGYRDVCPEYDGGSGFTCWHEKSGIGTPCVGDGEPVCNACSCAIPCEDPSDCPSGPLGETPTCLGSDTSEKSCFLACDEEACPIGMTCSTYPGVEGKVCMWVDPSVGMNTPR
jgi:hypothetical protein